MDKEVKLLLIEVAKAVLKALEPQAVAPRGRKDEVLVTPPAQTTPDDKAWRDEMWRKGKEAFLAASMPAPAPVQATPPEAAPLRSRGDYVRFWDGNRYVVGEVVNVCRRKVGQEPCVNVRVSRGEGRKGKTHKVECAKAELVKATGGVS